MLPRGGAIVHVTLSLAAPPFESAVKYAVCPADNEANAGLTDSGFEPKVAGGAALPGGIRVITAVPSCAPFPKLEAVRITVCGLVMFAGAE